MATRIGRLRKALSKERLGGIIISAPNNVRYLCGYTGSNGMMLVTARSAIFYTDFRYKEQIRTEVKGCRRRVLARDLYAGFPAADARGLRRIGVEKSHLTLARFQALRKQLRRARLVPVIDLVTELRRTKEPAELAKIAAAQRLNDRTFKKVLEMVKPGVSEAELALEVDFQYRRAGATNAFPSIIASGPNGAKPHAGFSARKLKFGDAVTFDIGCQLDGYCCDMTRTVFVGRAKGELRMVYEIVLEAQRRALAAVKPGAKASDADAAARNYIAEAGYGKYFGHGLGHGVGLEVHERPSLFSRSNDVLSPGDVFTVEPGIYLPALGGVRIEDLVAVTKAGARNLTRSPKRLIEA